MTLAALLNRPCTIVTRTESGTVNEYGDTVDTEATITTVCELQQKQRDENDDRGELAQSEWLLVLPAGTDVRLGDSVTVEDLVFEVVGEPWHARNPRTQAASHIEVTLARTAGSGDPQGS